MQEEPIRRRREERTSGDGFRRLNPGHAVFNFLHDYYNIRGAKGARRLGRWSPGLSRVTLAGATGEDVDRGTLSPVACEVHAGGVTYDAAQHFASAAPSAATPYLWYHDVLAATEAAEPVLHCYCLHEWAMQYWPEGAPQPPSRQYQDGTMPLRVGQAEINSVIERKGVRCTHVDALRFFAPAAGPLNRHGASLERLDQLRLEQPGCVHAHMDLLKIALRLSPWVPSELTADALQLALEARKLDVAASPYDASAFGIEPILIEHEAGRQVFRARQLQLMERAQPLRTSLLSAYETFLRDAFSNDHLSEAAESPSAERFATAQPGGLPWRRNLIELNP